jgi:hypothetical protein
MLQRLESRENAKHAVHVPHSDRFPLVCPATAHEHLEAEHVLGKTVLRIRQP